MKKQNPTSRRNFLKSSVAIPAAVAAIPATAAAAEGEKDALYAAIMMVDDRSWFFKITGNRQLAKVEKSNFLSFLESVCFH